MSTSRLAIYNGALLLCGERSLGSLTENREPRHLLDAVWGDGGLQFCLEQGQWNFAMRTAQMEADTDIDPSFGYQYGFRKPDDWVATSAVCSDEFFNQPVKAYADEVGVWFAAVTPLFVKWVSNDANFGLNLGNWPYSFTEYVKHYFASRIILKLSNDASRQQRLLGPPGYPQRGDLHTALITAKNRDAMAKPPQRPAQGGWTRARQGGSLAGDLGSTGSLIG